MRLFGVSLASVRYAAVFCGLVIVLLIHLLLRRHDVTAANVAALVAAVNFPLIVYNRLALLENLLLCFMLAAGMFLMAFVRDPRRLLLFGFWLAMILGYLTKASIAFFTIVFAGMVWRREWPVRRRALMMSVISFIALAVPLWFFWISPHLDDWLYYQQMNVTERFTFSPPAIAQNYARYLAHLKLFEFMPAAYVIALIMALRSAFDLAGKKTLSEVERLLCLWFWAGVLFAGGVAYSPPRYSLVLIPAIAGLNGLFFTGLFKQSSPVVTQRWPRAVFGIAGAIVFLQVIFGVYRIVAYRQLFLSCFLPLLGFAALYAASLALQAGAARRLAAWGLAALIVFEQAVQIIGFHAKMQFSLYDTIRKVDKIFGNDPRRDRIVLAGDSAMLLAFGLHVPTVGIMYRQDKLPEVIDRMRPNYLFLEDPSELARLRKQMPEYWQNLTELGRFRLMNNYTHDQDAVLYRVGDARHTLQQE
jgi:4-amino-4-deoxy-L-arabinose transferase-like glycosyltransferase